MKTSAVLAGLFPGFSGRAASGDAPSRAVSMNESPVLIFP
jgi:hypothetical protein